MVVVIFTLYQSPKKKSCILKESKYSISKFEYFNFDHPVSILNFKENQTKQELENG